MNIIFANKKLEKWANNFDFAQKKLGIDRATKYHKRLGDIRDIESFNDLQFRPSISVNF